MSGRRKIEDGESTPLVTTEPIHVKYRPRKLSEVVGQKAVVKSLTAALLASARPHCFLFTGPAGTGKTTLARIVSSHFECDPSNLIEENAANKTSVDDMRALLAPLKYQGFGASPNKAIILDECHRLSKNAWDALLKDTEEPPPHVFFFFCTSEPEKVPATMMRRCLAYNLSPVRFDDLMDLVEDVAERENYDTPERILSMVAQAANGSPGQMLQYLAAVHACDDEDEAAKLLAQPLDNKEVIDLCRLMVRGDLDWPKLTVVLKDLSDTPAESIRIVAVNYLNACIMGARSAKDRDRLLDMLQCFLKPCNPSDKLAPLLLAFDRFID